MDANALPSPTTLAWLGAWSPPSPCGAEACCSFVSRCRSSRRRAGVAITYSTIASGVCISGRCLIRRGAYLGSNSSIRENSVVGEGAMVAMAAVVTRDVAPGVTVLGCPARPHEAQS